MGGFFGVAKRERCVNELFYGVDYNSHMGTKRAGIATCNKGIFTRSIHNIENLKGMWVLVLLVILMHNLLL